MSSTLLIADNDAEMRDRLSGWLAEAGYTCWPTPADEALARADSHQFDGALVGVPMLQAQSLRVAKVLATRRHAAVVVVSPPDLRIAVEAAKAGASDCLPWPTSQAGVLESVERALRLRRSGLAQGQPARRLREEMARGRDELKRLVLRAHPDVAQTSLLGVLEARAPELHDHVHRVARWAVSLARTLELRADEVSELRRAALLHETGKAAVPHRVLAASKPLMDEEIQVLRTHPVLAEEILAAAPPLTNVAAIVRAAHERYDGGGFVSVLSGTGIPLPARIIAVADAYDGFTAARLGRNPLTHDEANIELVRMGGAELDPDLVHAWIRMTGEQSC